MPNRDDSQSEHDELRNELKLVWAELRWHKWLLVVIGAGVAGIYTGAPADVAQAAQSLVP